VTELTFIYRAYPNATGKIKKSLIQVACPCGRPCWSWIEAPSCFRVERDVGRWGVQGRRLCLSWGHQGCPWEPCILFAALRWLIRFFPRFRATLGAATARDAVMATARDAAMASRWIQMHSIFRERRVYIDYVFSFLVLACGRTWGIRTQYIRQIRSDVIRLGTWSWPLVFIWLRPANLSRWLLVVLII
jgi:hypothetical protein